MFFAIFLAYIKENPKFAAVLAKTHRIITLKSMKHITFRDVLLGCTLLSTLKAGIIT